MAFIRNSNLSNTGIIAAFPTCIYSGQYVDHIKYNTELLSMIEHLKFDQYVCKLSSENYGLGWTNYHATNGDFNSKYNLAKNPVTDALQKFIWDSTLEYFLFLGIAKEHIDNLRLGVMWANVNTKHSQHSAHIHPNAYYSGVYYVKAPKNSGKIIFTDPKNSIRSFELTPSERGKHSDAMVRQIEVEPEAGMLLLFPSWLVHEVQQHFIDDERISISFNIIPNFEILGDKTKEANKNAAS
jgi:uncharacterized protein (TIGR02466 family)